jgi:hypothetical protein
MGSRLGVIVLAESGPELSYDHWAAQTIGMDIAVDGFDPTLARVRHMQPMGVAAHRPSPAPGRLGRRK